MIEFETFKIGDVVTIDKKYRSYGVSEYKIIGVNGINEYRATATVTIEGIEMLLTVFITTDMNPIKIEL